MSGRLRIGTRGSRLALVQAGWVRRRLEAAHAGLRAELVVIRTSGDRFRDVPLSAVGGKGLFVKEIEAALIGGEIDCAVHSLKDLPGELLPGLVVAAVPEREDPRDVALTNGPGGLAGLPRGARVGTSSPRRAALLRALHPELDVVLMRGNVGTRLSRLARGEVEGLVLAAAGLRRLGIKHHYAVPCDPRQFVPAIGQGALALESRADEVVPLLQVIEDRPSRWAIDAERAFLSTVGGNCFTPMAAHADSEGDTLSLRAMIAHPDGSRIVRGEAMGPGGDAAQVGADLAHRLLESGGAEILRELGTGR